MIRELLRIYEEDDETVAFEFSTDPADPLPYLKRLLNTDEQQFDIRDASATIGALTCELVDVPTIAGDQDSGAITEALPNADGESVWLGHRAEYLREASPGGPLLSVFDGIVGGVELQPTLVTYRVTLEDISARGRKVRLFTHHETVSLIPPGPVNGFGRIRDGFDNTYYAIQPAGIVSARYSQVTATSGSLRLEFALGRMTQDIAEAGLPQMKYADTGEPIRATYPRLAVRWRANSADPWKTFRNMPVGPSGWDTAFRATNASNPDSDVLVWLARDPDEVGPPALPADDQVVQVQVLYSGPPTPAFPLYVEGPAGAVLKDICDGVYNEEPPRIRYDAVRMAELADEVEDLFAEIDAPADDAREWLREHWFGAFGYLGAIRDGLLYPIRLEMPDETPTLELDDSNVADASWSHDRADAVTVVEYTFIRHDRYIPLVIGPGILPGVSGSQTTARREVTTVFRSFAAATIGEQVARFKPVTVREIVAASPLSGLFDAAVRADPIVQRRSRHLLDRLRYGAQRVTVKASRHDAAVAAAQVGDWGLLGPSWLPEYETQRRGSNRLAQIVAARNIDARWREFVLLDAGPDADPLAQPTIGALAANDDGTVDVPVTAIPEGEAAVYYAVAAVQPPASSGQWLLAARIDAPATVQLPAAPAGATVHVRVRAEAEGRIYSSSVYDDATVPALPRIRDVVVELVGGTPIVRWLPNPYTLGVRLAYSVQTDISSAALDQTIDVDASLESQALPVNVPVGYTILVRVTPYSGWNGVNVTGTAGAAAEAHATRQASTQDPTAQTLLNFRDIRRTSTEVEFGWDWGISVEQAAFWVTEQSADVITDPWPAEGDPPDIIIDATDPPHLVVAVPPAGSLIYLEARARWDAGASVGPRWRGVITPAAGVVLEYMDVYVDGTTVTVYTDEAGLSIKLERTDVPGWVQHFDVGPDRKIVFDVSEESAPGEGDEIGVGETWPMLATVYGEPVNEVGVGTPEISEPLVVSEATATPAEWVASGMSVTSPALLDDVIDLTMHATDVPGTVEVWWRVKEPGLDYTEYARIDDTAEFTPDPNSVGNIPDAVLKAYTFESGYARRAKEGANDTATYFQFRFDLVVAGAVVATLTKTVNYYANAGA